MAARTWGAAMRLTTLTRDPRRRRRATASRLRRPSPPDSRERREARAKSPVPWGARHICRASSGCAGGQGGWTVPGKPKLVRRGSRGEVLGPQVVHAQAVSAGRGNAPASPTAADGARRLSALERTALWIPPAGSVLAPPWTKLCSRAGGGHSTGGGLEGPRWGLSEGSPEAPPPHPANRPTNTKQEDPHCIR